MVNITQMSRKNEQEIGIMNKYYEILVKGKRY